MTPAFTVQAVQRVAMAGHPEEEWLIRDVRLPT
jgi:hypothetical protein